MSQESVNEGQSYLFMRTPGMSLEYVKDCVGVANSALQYKEIGRQELDQISSILFTVDQILDYLLNNCRVVMRHPTLTPEEAERVQRNLEEAERIGKQVLEHHLNKQG